MNKVLDTLIWRLLWCQIREKEVDCLIPVWLVCSSCWTNGLLIKEAKWFTKDISVYNSSTVNILYTIDLNWTYLILWLFDSSSAPVVHIIQQTSCHVHEIFRFSRGPGSHPRCKTSKVIVHWGKFATFAMSNQLSSIYTCANVMSSNRQRLGLNWKH